MNCEDQIKLVKMNSVGGPANKKNRKDVPAKSVDDLVKKLELSIPSKIDRNLSEDQQSDDQKSQ